MKPIHITLEGFGSYKNRVEFPLEKMGEEGLYLITGNTGAGKTTLFDGICFALFGMSSGGKREESDLEHNQGLGVGKSLVDLIFEVGGHRYQVYRYLHLIKSRKKENEEAERKTDWKVEFKCLTAGTEAEKEVLTKKKEVEIKIKELLGLDGKKFTQIAMIPQGAFQDVLLKNTEERTEVLRSVFQTEDYEKLQEQVDVHYRATKVAVTEKEKELQRLEGEIARHSEDLGTTAEYFDHLNHGKLPMEAKVPRLEEVQAIYGKRLAFLKRWEEKAEGELGQVRDWFTQLRSAKETLEKKEAVETQKKAQEVAVAGAREEKAAISGYPEEIKELEQRGEVLKQEVKRFGDLLEKEGVLEKDKKALEEKAVLEEGLSLEVEKAEKKWKEEGLYVESHQSLNVEMATLQQKVKEEKENLERYGVLEGALDLWEKKALEVTRGQEVYELRRGAYMTAKACYDKAQALFLDGQAGVLASRLKEGEPCTVCGSREHPNPAACLEEVPTEEELNGYKDTMEAEKERWERSSGKVSGLELEREKALTVVQEQGRQVFSCEDVERLRECLESGRRDSTLEEDRGLLEELEKTQKEWERRKEKLSAWEDSYKKKEQEYQLHREERVKSSVALEERGRVLEEERKELGEGTGEKQREELALCQAKGEEKTLAWENVEENLKKAEQLLTQLEGQAQGLGEVTADESLFDMESRYEKWQMKWQGVMDKCKEEYIPLYAVHERNARILPQLGAVVAESMALEKKLGWLKPLRQMVKGQGRMKMTFETYVQQRYFCMVLSAANRSLKGMNGAYEMLLRKENDKKGQVGLDIDVRHMDTGLVRRGQTLSGGESFQASLALALGFSEVISNSSQSAPLESLFLDEGFDALDGDSLMMAVGILEELACAGRTIGVISHVEGLKEQIPRKIVVTKDARGSRVRFVGVGQE